ncbi:MAG: transcription termination factor Rho [Clostridia bacterium]|nr:transcription termination factor Rho [Clostridia bacterium]MDD4376061.1 transcription termination factor Rho [Clostridia bacterium]
MYNKEDLKKSTLTELREIAEKIKLDGYQRLKKEYLIEEIIKMLEEKKELDVKTDIQIENAETDYIAEGILEVLSDGYGFLRSDNYLSGNKDIYVSGAQIRRFNLSSGDMLKGIARFTTEPQNKFPSMIYVQSINGDTVDVALNRKSFEALIPIYPNERLKLETEKAAITMRIIDLLAPIGKGQRGMIVAPPKVGKTTILKQIANSILKNNKEITMLVLLIDERPEEVTDIERSIDAEVIASTFDESPEHHIKVAKMVLERAKRLVEHNKDVVILLDSITRLARANNLSVEPSGRTLSGGLDPACLHFPKKFFGAARNIENGGSLTILATALTETGSRMDEIIFEEFKGTGNMEVHLDRKLSERRIFPSLDIHKSGTRREDLLLTKEEMEASTKIHKLLNSQSGGQLIETSEKIFNMFYKTKNNKDFIEMLNKSIVKKEK